MCRVLYAVPYTDDEGYFHQVVCLSDYRFIWSDLVFKYFQPFRPPSDRI